MPTPYGNWGTAIDIILHSRTENNWKDKLTAYDGQGIAYDAIGNPLNDGRRRYEWQAGRQLKKVYVKADLKEGTKAGGGRTERHGAEDHVEQREFAGG